MKTRMRGIATRTTIVIVALGIALGTVAGSPDTADAAKKRAPARVSAGCVWSGARYSHGGRHTYVDLFGWTIEMECRNGAWVQTGSRPPKTAP